MTTPSTYAEPIGERLPSDDERRGADQLRHVIAHSLEAGAPLRLARDKGETAEITLAPGLSELLLDVLRLISAGDAVTLVPVSQRLTTQQAADLLNVSRPHLITLLDQGEIPHTLTGRHRRIEARDIFAYKSKRDSKRRSALRTIAEMDGPDI